MPGVQGSGSLYLYHFCLRAASVSALLPSPWWRLTCTGARSEQGEQALADISLQTLVLLCEQFMKTLHMEELAGIMVASSEHTTTYYVKLFGPTHSTTRAAAAASVDIPHAPLNGAYRACRTGNATFRRGCISPHTARARVHAHHTGTPGRPPGIFNPRIPTSVSQFLPQHGAPLHGAGLEAKRHSGRAEQHSPQRHYSDGDVPRTAARWAVVVALTRCARWQNSDAP